MANDYGVRYCFEDKGWYTRSPDGIWVPDTVSGAGDYLVQKGISPKVPNNRPYSDVDIILRQAKDFLHCHTAGYYAGYLQAGDVVIKGRKVLILEDVALPTPVQGNCDMTKELFSAVFPKEDQDLVMHSWIHWALQELRNGKPGSWHPGQAMIWIGEPGVGKTALQGIIKRYNKYRRPTPPREQSVHDLLRECPQPGAGVHQAVLGAVRGLSMFGFRSEEIPDLVTEWLSRPAKPGEIEDAIKKVFNGDGDPRRADHEPKDRWPALDSEFLLGLAEEMPDALERLTSLSPVRDQVSPSEWLAALIAEDDLLCIMANKFDTRIKERSEWSEEELDDVQLWVPSAFRFSDQSRVEGNVLWRRYLDVEIDIVPKSSLARAIAERGLDLFVVQAAAILYLWSLDLLTLRSVLFSGTKSLHSFWQSDGEKNREFFALATSVGADPQMWRTNQPARIANPASRQPILFLHPRDPSSYK